MPRGSAVNGFLERLAAVFDLNTDSGVRRAEFSAAEPAKTVQRVPEEQSDIDVYRSAAPSVVFINSSVVVPRYSYLLDPDQEHGRVVRGMGSGVVLDGANGIIVTNLHVVNGADALDVKLHDGSISSAKVIATDPTYDIAFIKLSDVPAGLKGISIGDSATLEVGQRVLAIGNPMGLDGTLTTGIVSAPPRTIMSSPDSPRMHGLIQTDAAINPGNSGGALLDSGGNLIGINQMIFSTSGGSQGLGFAIPVNPIKVAYEELSKTGKITRPFIGASLLDTDRGLALAKVLRGGALDRVGIEVEPEGSISVDRFGEAHVEDPQGLTFITKVNGKSIRTSAELETSLRSIGHTDSFSMTISKGLNQEQDYLIKPDRRDVQPEPQLRSGSLRRAG